MLQPGSCYPRRGRVGSALLAAVDSGPGASRLGGEYARCCNREFDDVVSLTTLPSRSHNNGLVMKLMPSNWRFGKMTDFRYRPDETKRQHMKGNFLRASGLG